MSLFDLYSRKIISQLNSAYTRAQNAYIAVSAGMDSMCLLHLLNQGKNTLRASLNVIHVSHGIRSKEEAECDRAIVQSACRRFDIPLILDAIKQGELEQWQNHSGGLESAARKYRYSVMHKHLSENDVLLTAHHADDLIETILLSILNSHIGMPLQSMDNRIIRPYLLLDPPIDKRIISQICEEKRIPYNSDATNTDDSYNRNYIRNQLIPLMETRFSGFAKRMLGLYNQWNIIQNALKTNSPPSPWKSLKPLGKLVYQSTVDAISSIPLFYAINALQSTILEILSYCAQRRVFLRIPSDKVINIIMRLQSEDTFQTEAYGIVFLRFDNNIYLHSALAFSVKKGYFKTIRFRKYYFLNPLFRLQVRCMIEGASAHGVICIRPLLKGDSKNSVVKNGLRELILVNFLRKAVMVIADENNAIALIYPDMQMGKWRIVNLHANLKINVFLEEVYERE